MKFKSIPELISGVCENSEVKKSVIEIINQAATTKTSEAKELISLIQDIGDISLLARSLPKESKSGLSKMILTKDLFLKTVRTPADLVVLGRDFPDEKQNIIKLAAENGLLENLTPADRQLINHKFNNFLTQQTSTSIANNPEFQKGFAFGPKTSLDGDNNNQPPINTPSRP
jgi:hypothetical protein